MGSLRILMAAGGSGGHLFPAQQLARQLVGDEVLFAGHLLGVNRFFHRESHAWVDVEAAPLAKGFMTATWRGFWRALQLMRSFRPDVVVGFGSFHVVPVLLAAVVLRKKIVLFEANCTLGKVNRLFRPFAYRVVGQFLQGHEVPLVPWEEWKEETHAREYFGLGLGKTLLVFGGSQGAQFLNEVMPKVCEGLDLQVIHLGQAAYSVPSCVKSFETNMAKAYAAADVAVCRAGAGTIAELIRFGVPAVCIPYPYAGGHQRSNGEFFEQIGGGKMVVQEEASVERLRAEVQEVMRRKEECRQALKAYGERAQKRVAMQEVVREAARRGSCTI